MHASYAPEAHNFLSFALRSSIFELCPNFEKTAPKWPWHNQGQKYLTCIPIYTQKANFSSVSLYDEQFSSYGSILRKVHRLTSKWPWCSPSTYSQDSHIFAPFALWWDVFEIHPNFEKSPPNEGKSTSKRSRSKVSLYDELFSSYRQFWKKCTVWPNKRSKDLGVRLDSCSWDDVSNFM